MRTLFCLALVACSGSSSSMNGGDDTQAPDASSPDGNEPVGPRLIPPEHPLANKARAYDRQFHIFNAMPFGLSLDAWITDAGNRTLVTNFMAQAATDDFAAFAGKSVAQIVEQYDEHGDLGMFAGAAAAGEAFRYMALHDAASRADLLEAIASFHVAATITGTPGTVARGIRRLDEPGPVPATEAIPTSCPQAGDRGNRWRTGNQAGWIYNDNNSKDQIIGYVFALGAFWDAIGNDASIPQNVKDQLQADARALGQSLMQPVQLGFAGSADLIVRDWNNCPTKHLDLNPRVVPINGQDPLILPGGSTNQNGWNALASLGVIRTLFHVSGDAAIGRYYYNELVGTRDFPKLAVSGPAHTGAMYQDGGNPDTNFSNVNMAFVAAYGLLRYETDPALRTKYEALLASELWNVNSKHDGESIHQAFFDLMWSAFRTAGNDAMVTAGAIAQLDEFAAPPYFDVPVENCDAGEMAAGTCTAIDGSTITLTAANSGLSRDPLPKRLRPPSNFEWRSDPRSVNGGGVIRLNPGGDFRLAYWMGRVLGAATSGNANVSPLARVKPPS